ncbi:MAG: ATP-dependent DNA ligase [Weeksellaceae bacterium]|nr:ATP-dependent DNA ligase [Weeksellaceae bacterium]
MKRFAQLISALENTNKTLAKKELLVRYFTEANDADKLWVVALFTGKRPKRPVNSNQMREWCMQLTQTPAWLFQECYTAIGDLSETMALLVQGDGIREDKPLHVWMNEIIKLRAMDELEKQIYVVEAWLQLGQAERFVFNKLIGGSLRIGVSKNGMVNALADFAGSEKNEIMHALAGKWHPEEISFDELIAGEHVNTDLSKPYPFCLAYALDKELHELGEPQEWIAEYKWDGIRGQVIRRQDEIFIWSRGEELVTEQFPELVEEFSAWTGDFVIDGEILAVKDDEVLNFNHLQKRLNRKTISAKMMKDIPISFFAYDCLEYEAVDLRAKPMRERRDALEKLFEENQPIRTRISESIAFDNWQELVPIRENAREINSEGLMLKQLSSEYHAGRKKGDWWKWKVDPLTIDAVMIYAQRGSGRRSGHYTDYTFAVRTDGGLVTVAKAYSGLTNEEIKEVSKFVNKNATEKFGPVRTVPPKLVFEIAFEGIAYSNRHKSGVALRFPRIQRWRKEKSLEDIDHIDDVKALIHAK